MDTQTNTGRHIAEKERQTIRTGSSNNAPCYSAFIYLWVYWLIGVNAHIHAQKRMQNSCSGRQSKQIKNPVWRTFDLKSGCKVVCPKTVEGFFLKQTVCLSQLREYGLLELPKNDRYPLKIVKIIVILLLYWKNSSSVSLWNMTVISTHTCRGHPQRLI